MRGLFFNILIIKIVNVINSKSKIVRVSFELILYIFIKYIRIFSVEAFYSVYSRVNVKKRLAILESYLINLFNLIYRLTSNKAATLDIISFVNNYVIIIFYKDRNRR